MGRRRRKGAFAEDERLWTARLGRALTREERELVRRPKFRHIEENELAARNALRRREYFLALMLIHSLIEGLCRCVRGGVRGGDNFAGAAAALIRQLRQDKVPERRVIALQKKLETFNAGRNRIVHVVLWHKGYGAANALARDRCKGLLGGLYLQVAKLMLAHARFP